MYILKVSDDNWYNIDGKDDDWIQTKYIYLEIIKLGVSVEIEKNRRKKVVKNQ